MAHAQPAVGRGARQPGARAAAVAAAHGVADVVLHVGDDLHQQRRAQHQQRGQQVDGAGALEAQRRADQHRADGHEQAARSHRHGPGRSRSGPYGPCIARRGWFRPHLLFTPDAWHALDRGHSDGQTLRCSLRHVKRALSRRRRNRRRRRRRRDLTLAEMIDGHQRRRHDSGLWLRTICQGLPCRETPNEAATQPARHSCLRCARTRRDGRDTERRLLAQPGEERTRSPGRRRAAGRTGRLPPVAASAGRAPRRSRVAGHCACLSAPRTACAATATSWPRSPKR